MLNELEAVTPTSFRRLAFEFKPTGELGSP